MNHKELVIRIRNTAAVLAVCFAMLFCYGTASPLTGGPAEANAASYTDKVWTETTADGVTFTYRLGWVYDDIDETKSDIDRWGAIIQSVDLNGSTEWTLPETTDSNIDYSGELTSGKNKVTGFTADAFAGNRELKKIVLSQYVLSVPANAFDGCTALEEIDFGLAHAVFGGAGETPSLTALKVTKGNEYLSVKNGILFAKDKSSRKKLAIYPSARKDTVYELPSDIYGVQSGAFCKNQYLEELVIPSSGIVLEADSFAGCDRIKTITFSNGGKAVKADTGLKPERYAVSADNESVAAVDGVLYSAGPADTGEGGTESCGEELIAYPSGKTAAEYTVPEGIETIGDAAFDGSSLEDISLPKTMRAISMSAFNGCGRLDHLVIPNNVYVLNGWELSGCSSLRYITVPPHTISIMTGRGEINTDVVIKGEEGSYAQEFADENGIPFEAVEIPLYAQTIESAYSGKTLTMRYGDAPVSVDLKAMTALSTGLSDSSVAGIELIPRSYSYGDGLEIHKGMTVKALKPGTTKLTLKAEGTDAFEPAETGMTIRVLKKEQEVTTPKSSYSGDCGEKVRLKAKASTKMTYKSSNKSVVKVSKKGKLTFTGPGKATVTVMAAETGIYEGAEKKIKVKSQLARPKIYITSSEGKVKLRIKKVPYAKQVQLYIKFPGKSKYKKVMTRTADLKSVTHRGLKKGKVYKYKVRVRTKIKGKYYCSKFSKVRKVKAR